MSKLFDRPDKLTVLFDKLYVWHWDESPTKSRPNGRWNLRLATAEEFQAALVPVEMKPVN